MFLNKLLITTMIPLAALTSIVAFADDRTISTGTDSSSSDKIHKRHINFRDSTGDGYMLEFGFWHIGIAATYNSVSATANSGISGLTSLAGFLMNFDYANMRFELKRQQTFQSINLNTTTVGANFHWCRDFDIEPQVVYLYPGLNFSTLVNFNF